MTATEVNRMGTSDQRQTKEFIGEAGDPCTIQDLYLQECLLGVKLAERCTTTEALRQRLSSDLPQNSPGTRDLYARRITTWLFPNGALDSAPLAVWRSYHDEQLLLDHFRARYLEAIPLLGKFVAGPLGQLEVGGALTPEAIMTYVSRECGRPVDKSRERIGKNLTKLGFLVRRGKELGRSVPNYDPTSVILELHRWFSQSPTTVPFAEIAAHPFWRFVGVPDVFALERVLYDGVRSGLLAKFVKSDELNQITTGYGYRDILASRLRVAA